MNALSRKVARFLIEEDGPTTVEYAMMLLLVFLTTLTAITVLGRSTAESYEPSGSSVEEAFSGP
jgi:pilus assembly protein Flp/PilA